MVSDEEVESCVKRTHHRPNDHYDREERAPFPYSPRLELHAGRHPVGCRPCWSPSGSVSVLSPTVSGPHVLVIRSSVWPAPPASPPSPGANEEIGPRWVSLLGC